jgi:hypothetical protein
MAIKPSTTAPTRKAVFNMTTILFEIFSLLLAPYFFLSHSRVEPRCGFRRRGELLLPAAFAKVPVSQSSP